MMPRATTAIFETRTSVCSLARPCRDDDWHRGRCRSRRRRSANVEAGDHRKDGGEGDRGDEAEEEIAAQRLRKIDRRHVGAALQCDALGRVHQIGRIAGHEHDRAEADDEGQDVEVWPMRQVRVLHRKLTRRLGVPSR